VTVRVYVVVEAGLTLTAVPLVAARLPRVITPVPLENTPVRLVLPPAVMVAEPAVKLVIVGAGGGGAEVPDPPHPTTKPIHTLSATA
jgi:hypothetical protein